MPPLNFCVELAIHSNEIAVFSSSVAKLSTFLASFLLGVVLLVGKLAFVVLGLAVSSDCLAVWSLGFCGPPTLTLICSGCPSAFGGRVSGGLVGLTVSASIICVPCRGGGGFFCISVHL